MVVEKKSTQENHPNKAALRTFIQTVIPTAVFLVGVIPEFVKIVLDEFGNAGVEVPGWLFAVLSGASVACALIAAIAARVMAIPGVEAKLRKIGIGAEPKTKFAQGGYVGPAGRVSDVESSGFPDDGYNPKH